jgi:hypothetical protein
MQAVTHKGLLDVMARREERVLFQVGAQPPARAVCQRLLKPRPSVYLVVPPLEDPSSSSPSSPSSSSASSSSSSSSSSSAEGESLRRLYAALDSTTPGGGVFVVASVVRLDSGALMPHAIDGQSTLRLQKVRGQSPHVRTKQLHFSACHPITATIDHSNRVGSSGSHGFKVEHCCSHRI